MDSRSTGGSVGGAAAITRGSGHSRIPTRRVAIRRTRTRAAVDAGEAAPHVDPELTSRLLFGAWNGMSP